MTSLYNFPQVMGIDFETANGKRESVCQIGLTLIRHGEEVKTFSTLLKPPAEFGDFWWKNTQVHGIRAYQVINAPEWPKLFRKLQESLDRITADSPLVFAAHNASFDKGVFLKVSEYYNLPRVNIQWVDTLKTSRRVFPDLDRHRLSNVALRLGFDDVSRHHDAGWDSEITAAMAFKYGNSEDFLKETVKRRRNKRQR